ncbi:hypothetical protein Taro_008263 [Colocasia esculenta]|uniref:Protein kinase domain-containing protein n=1 Tax=Colocasia esculenta TaxID=4460 RepID=A0A843U1W4_COLES|nr:hypothetical protein [Colocasia esculenta]
MAPVPLFRFPVAFPGLSSGSLKFDHFLPILEFGSSTWLGSCSIIFFTLPLDSLPLLIGILRFSYLVFSPILPCVPLICALCLNLRNDEQEPPKLKFAFHSFSPFKSALVLVRKTSSMKCFSFFKEVVKGRASEKNTATSSTPVTRPVSPNGTSRSSHTTSIKQTTSKSSLSASSARSLPELYEERAHNLRVFELRELRNATNDFSRLFKIGEGGFGSVYKGLIRPPDGYGNKIAVAIKKLNEDGPQGHKQWCAEVQFLGVVDHPNLVKLIGYCAIDSETAIQRLLVYEFMPNKSLEEHLFNKTYPALSWDKRLKIATGVAEGLRYLHEDLEVQVIYRDFKASNILLDEDFKPKLSDFGLAREGPSDGCTHVTTAVVGTYGYAAPDYVETGHLTIKSDVWSFGVVLLEILTGRRSLERNRPRPEQKLLEWVKQFPVESRTFSMMMDPRLGDQYSVSAARLIAKLANSCLSKYPKDRPSMSEVVASLKRAIEVSETGVQMEPSEERHTSNTTDLEVEKTEQVNGSESARRRMLHLAKLKQIANAESRRKFVIMQRANRT